MKLVDHRLKIIRTKRKLTMRQVAEGIGVPLTTYREWEYGRSIRSEHLLKLASFFGVSVEELMGGVQSDLNVEQRLHRIREDVSVILSELQKQSKK